LRRLAFAVAVAVCLVRAAIALFVELPRTPLVRDPSAAALRSVHRPEYLDAIRAQAPEGNLLLRFQLPAGAENLAALIYYQSAYDLYPRRVVVTDEPAVINDGSDLLRHARRPDPEWLAAHGVLARVELSAVRGRLHLAVVPAQAP
jgi:hypothetical protein